jgi:ABC-2 type transport system ATP-binding protein
MDTQLAGPAGAAGPATPAVSAAIEARSLGRMYGSNWALQDCTLDIPAGRVTGLVGPNGAGKTTLLNLATGMLRPTSGSIRVLGGTPGHGTAQLRKVGFVAQETPVYAGLSVADHLKFGQHMNARWDAQLAAARIRELKLDPRRKAGRMSGGQRAQLALTMALARRPDLLILDEPVASLDPLARREFLKGLAEATAGTQMSVVMSSHLVSDLERICDYLIVLVASRIQIAGPVTDLLAGHQLVSGPSVELRALPGDAEIISAARDLGQTTAVIRAAAVPQQPAWTVTRPNLEDVVLAYMSRAGTEADGTEADGTEADGTEADGTEMGAAR